MWQLFRDHEPSYQGRTLSQWVDQTPEGWYVNSTEAPEAIRRIGTNAIPTILKWISYESSPLRTRIAMLLSRLHLQPRFTLYPEQRADHAEIVFSILGPEARAAIPELTRLALTSSDDRRSHRCINSLSYLGPDALPSLLTIVTNNPLRSRAVAISRLPKFYQEARAFVPVLIQCVGDQDNGIALEAVEALGKLRVERSLVLPGLTYALRSPSVPVRLRAMNTIRSISSPTSEAVPFLLPMLTDPEPLVRYAASNALHKIAPEVFTNDLLHIAPATLTNAPPQ